MMTDFLSSSSWWMRVFFWTSGFNSTCSDGKVTDRHPGADVASRDITLHTTEGSAQSVNMVRPWEITKIYCLDSMCLLNPASDIQVSKGRGR